MNLLHILGWTFVKLLSYLCIFQNKYVEFLLVKLKFSINNELIDFILLLVHTLEINTTGVIKIYPVILSANYIFIMFNCHRKGSFPLQFEKPNKKNSSSN